MADCWYLKGNNQGPTKLTMTAVRTQGHCGQEIQGSVAANSYLCDEYKPFIPQGYVSLPGSTVKTPITIHANERKYLCLEIVISELIKVK